MSVLELLEAVEGPVLADFPDDAPESEVQQMTTVCPISFAGSVKDISTTDLMLNAFRDELSHMLTWYELARRKAGRTTSGVSGLFPEEIADAMAAFLRGNTDVRPVAGLTTADTLRMAAEDLKTCYFEALAAQPGQNGGPLAMADWFWGQTVAAQIINAVRNICLGIPGNDFQLLGKLLLVPRVQLYRFNKK